MNYFEYMSKEKPVGDVVEFKIPERDIEHVDSSTIVEKLEMTDEMRAEFEAAGYTIEETDSEDRKNDPEPRRVHLCGGQEQVPDRES